MSVVTRLIRAVRADVESDTTFTDELFSDYRYVYGAGRACHRLVVERIQECGRRLDGVADVTGNKNIRKGMTPRWQPDVVLWASEGAPMCVVEYESLNSSDERVIEKDAAGYRRWMNVHDDPTPLLIVTTLPNAASPWYRLRYADKDPANNYNWRHHGKESEVQRNPFLYWYRHYRAALSGVARGSSIEFANFDGRRLRRVDLDTLEATEA